MKVKSESEVAQLCPTLQDPMDCSPPGSSVHGIFQARVLERVTLMLLIYNYEWIITENPYGDLPDPGIKPMSPVSSALAEFEGWEQLIEKGIFTNFYLDALLNPV
ncbi:hypothetical protein R6Z07M_004396 [Ovis aries]